MDANGDHEFSPKLPPKGYLNMSLNSIFDVQKVNFQILFGKVDPVEQSIVYVSRESWNNNFFIGPVNATQSTTDTIGV